MCTFVFLFVLLIFLFCIVIWPINNVVIVSGRQQRDWVIHTHAYILPQLPQHVAFCVSLFSDMHNIFKIHLFCSTNRYFIWFYVWIIFHCMDKPHFVYSLIINGWILDCFYFLDVIKICHAHSYISFCVDIFSILWVYTQEWNFWVMW